MCTIEQKLPFVQVAEYNFNFKLSRVVYYPYCHCLVGATYDKRIFLIDVKSGEVFKKIRKESRDDLNCQYLPSLERLVTSSGDVLSTRKEHNGVLLLDNIFQQQVQTPEDVVNAVLSLNDAIHLLVALLRSDLARMKNIAEFLKDLKQEVSRVKETIESNHKKDKWKMNFLLQRATICLRRPHGSLLKTLTSILGDMKRIRMDLPGLSVISSLVDQVSLLSVNSELLHPLDSSGFVDKGLMHNECVRRSTFKDWPFLNYKWVFPIPMAQAGFFYNPNSSVNNGDDRAMCFVCNVCLIYREATNKPWSKHERHSPHCPFVMGEYTQNVPISATHATEPAKVQSFGNKVTSIGFTTSSRFFATVMSNHYIVVWDTNTFLKEHAVININPNDSIICTALKSKLMSNGAKNEDDKQTIVGDLPPFEANIGAVCLISQPLEVNSETSRPGNSRNFVIVGTNLSFSFEDSKGSDMPSKDGMMDDKSTDEMMMNRLNQENNVELGGTQAKDMSYEFKKPFSKSTAVNSLCILVYDMTFEAVKDVAKVSTPADSSSSKQKHNSKKSLGKSYSPHQDPMSDLNMVEEILDDNQDIQIVDFKLSMNLDGEEASGKLKPKIILTSNSGQVASYDTSATPLTASLNITQNSQDTLKCKKAVLCIPLPEEIKSSRKLNFKHILPSHDGSRLFVVIGAELDDVTGNGSDAEEKEIRSWTLIYKISHFKTGPLIDKTPLAVSSHRGSITSACLCEKSNYEDSRNNDKKTWFESFPSALIITSTGDAKLLSLRDLSLNGRLKSSSGIADHFTLGTYCSRSGGICLISQHPEKMFTKVMFFMDFPDYQSCCQKANESLIDSKIQVFFKLTEDILWRIIHQGFKKRNSQLEDFIRCNFGDLATIYNLQHDFKSWTKEKQKIESCGVILKDEFGHILMVKQETGKWGLPKGSREGKECPWETAKREVLEELVIPIIGSLENNKTIVFQSDNISKCTFFIYNCQRKDVDSKSLMSKFNRLDSELCAHK